MKIVQLLARIEGSGVTRYVIEFNRALIEAGHDTEIIYLNPVIENGNIYHTGQTIENAIEYDWTEDTIKHINEADLVIVNSIIDGKSPKRDEWIDLVQNKITTKKVIVINDHKPIGFRMYYGDLLKRPEFWMSFNKICTFSYTAKVYSKIRDLIGEDAAKQRYMHLLHPYHYDDNIKANWVSLKDKIKRVAYFGRHCTFKDNARLLRGCKDFWKHEFELEMRGIRATINITTIPNFRYVLDEKTLRPIVKDNWVRGDKYVLSPYTYWCDDKRWRREHNVDPNDLMIRTPERELERIYIFSAYKREEGMRILSQYQYGCNFYHLDDETCYGDNLEYTIFEMIQYGTIPMLDYHAASSIHLMQENGEFSEKSLIEDNLAIALKKDLSNIEDCLTHMEDIVNNGEYETLLNNMYNKFKTHSDPQMIVKKFLDDVNN